jgi:REP element-mobilizing transposase RayT
VAAEPLLCAVVVLRCGAFDSVWFSFEQYDVDFGCNLLGILYYVPNQVMARRGRMKQLELELKKSHGGARKGAGRKPKNGRGGVSHHGRPKFPRTSVLHVTMKMAAHVWNLRSSRPYMMIVAALREGAEHEGFRIAHFSVQKNHIHFIVEADSTRDLSAGMQGLSVRIARGLNKLMRRSGRVIKDRFHDHLLKTALEVKRTVEYVLCNARKHRGLIGQRTPNAVAVDPMSSARTFDGWNTKIIVARSAAPPPPSLPKATHRLLREGWRKHGLLDPARVPSRA